MNAPRPQHAPLTQFAVADDCLQVGGIALTRLAQRVGQTPFYAYDRAALTARVAELRQHLPADVHLHYAMKANPMPAVVQHMATLVDGIDVASGGELRVALDTPMDPQHISFAGPGKSDADLASAIAAGIVINLESEGEMERAAAIGVKLGIAPRVNVRVNPDFELKSSGMKMGGGPKQFGVDAERVPAMLDRIGALGLDFYGFHIFSGSQNLKVAALEEAHEKTLALAIRLAEAAPRPPRIVNIGGGFGIPYFPGEERLDLAQVGANLARLLEAARPQLGGAQIVIELGRFLVGEAGVYVCRVIDRKESRGHVYLVTDGGLHHHLSASGNFGQVIRKNYPVVIGNRVRGTQREKVSVVGPLCTPLDLLADQMELAHAGPGDLVAVLQSGAYGLTASPGAFLSQPAALEVLV
ncbi:pyridoxal-dependent decarboxylase, exosortase A system-associated [Pseudoduganella buxea]|uniref:Pyridoxal-dependent decarboxylase, exosortase A system-associated n=1 Tax=Pseudoduganella buxea TaxID=1949069 RepID=A0A6I3T338_9BURK|nr:pyridoxal-dependent decarboxylase, exosortase A system-associated [Pseudoduganella buxea]MTV55829.1 pyridoxal-dependent decarboxylase, exosortase A system-associated [Pseudoduganella buxea]GGC17113.1 pyridoxal-dependent decarboxylase, exosortase A system-associated [Pseudoduganella buxea]